MSGPSESNYQPSSQLDMSFMSRFYASDRAAGTPEGPIVSIHVRLADASRQGRASVASCGPRAQDSASGFSVRAPERQNSASKFSVRAPEHQDSASGCQSVSRQSLGRQVQTQGRSQSQYRPASRLPPPAKRRSAAELRADSTFAEDEQVRAIARFQRLNPVVRVAAISAVRRAPSPDHYGLRRHVEDDARQANSPEEQPSATSQPVSRR